MRIGIVLLPEQRWQQDAARWRRAEQLGFAHAWTYDHLAWRDLRDGPWLSAVPLLTAAATTTSTIRLGTLVASPNFRHPVPFARELITLDDVSGGRLTVGIGAGGRGWDAAMLGRTPLDLAARQARFGEFVDLLDRLLTDREVDHRGRFFTAVEARTYPGCVQRPRIPFAIAATGPRSMEIAARQGSVWVTDGPAPDDGVAFGPDRGAVVMAEQLRRFERTCERLGRDPAGVDKLVMTGGNLDDGLRDPGRFREIAETYREVGFTDLVVHWPRSTDPYQGDPAVLDDLDLSFPGP